MIQEHVKLTRVGKLWKGLCPFHREKTPSFTVHDDGHFHCFGCNSHGTVFDFVMLYEHIGFPEAIKRVAAQAGLETTDNNTEWIPILPAPTDAPKPPDKTLLCDMLHEYRDAGDRLLCYVRRFERQGSKGKQFLPLTYGALKGRRGWHQKAPHAPRPLYRLNSLSHAPADTTVLLCEGEKAAEAAQRVFPDHVAMSWMGGANADAGADLSPLRGRSVVIWPDADEPGREVARRLAKRLLDAKVLDTEGLPKGFDAADLEASGCDDPEAWLDARLRSLQPTAPNHDPWPDPVDFLGDDDVTGTPNLREEHLPSALYPFVVDTAARMGVDPASVALASVVTIASVANDEWRLQVKRRDDEWTEAPRLWGAIVGDPSVLKSPVIRICTKPIDFLEVQARERYESEMHQFEKDQQEWHNDGRDPEKKPKQPLLDRYLVEGTTVEALSEVLRVGDQARHRAPAGKVLIRQDEMSEWLAGFDRYRAGGRGGSDRGAYLRLYNGGRYTIDRVGRGSFAVPNWSACVLGGIQPDPIRRIAQETTDDGLLQRFIFCVAEGQGEGEDSPPDKDASKRYQALLMALATLHPPSVSAYGSSTDSSSVQSVVFHAHAHQHRLAIEQLARAISAMPDASDRMKAALGKWPGLFARVALTFHLAEIGDARAKGVATPPLTVIPEITAQRAANYMRDILLPHLIRADATMFATAQTSHAKWIAGLILARNQPRITDRDIVHAYRPLRAPECRRERQEVMESLVTVGWLLPEEQANPSRPPAAWAVNPKVLSLFSERAERERQARAQGRKQILERLARNVPGKMG
jgi:hypothetical protein